MTTALLLGGSRLIAQRFCSAATSVGTATVRTSSFQLQHCAVGIRYASTAKDIFVPSQDSLAVRSN